MLKVTTFIICKLYVLQVYT